MEQENLNIQESQQESIQEGSLRGGKGNNTGGNGPQTPFEDNRPESLEQKELLSSLNNGPQNLENTLEQQLLNNAPQDQTGLNENQEDNKEITEEEPADQEIAPFVLEEEPQIEESTEEVGTETDDGGEGGDDGAIDAPELPPINPLDDPDFQGMEERIGEQGELMGTHEESGLLAESAQQGAPLAGNENMGLAEAQQVEEMSVQEPKAFDAAAFKDKLLQKINAILPKTEEEADDFEDNDGLGEVSQSVKESVDQEKENAGGPIETKTEEEPDTGEVVEREIEEIQAPEPGELVTDLNVEEGMPDPREDTYVEEPINDRVDQVDGLMEDNEITDDQLANSNEPTFIESLNQKNEAKDESEQAPQELRGNEQGILDSSQSSASGSNEEGLTQIFTDRENFLMQVMENQQSSSEENSAERERISGEIHDIYQQTKIDVESILSNLDTEVQARFDRASSRAKSNFLSYVNAKMDAYKEERYDGIEGAFTWVGDAFTGLPDEVNAFYREGRNRYINEMDTALTDIADYIAQQLTGAKERITEGRQEVVDYVNELPDNLRSIGENAAGAIQARFDELDTTVDNKQGELINSLAQQYADSLNEVDEAIKAMQEANKGLIDAVLDAVGGVIETILEIKRMLTELVTAAIEVIGAIIADPIGFLSNLIDGVSQGIAGFVNNISDHLLTGLVEWLMGAMSGVGITLPEDLFSFTGILDLVAQVLGLTWDYVREKAVYAIGEDAVSAIENSFEIFQVLQTDGLVGAWEYIQGQLANLQEMVIGGIQEFLITSVIQAGVEWILGLLTPAGAFIKAAMAVIDIIKFFVENGSQIMALMQSIIDSLAAIVAGDVGFVAESVEAAMASAVPVLIGFLASLLGIDGLADKVQEIIQSIRKRIDDAITGLIDKAKDWFKGRKGDSEDKDDENVDEIIIPFTMNGEDHTLYIREGEIRMASSNARDLATKIGETEQALQQEGITTKDLTEVNQEFKKVLKVSKSKKFKTLKTRDEWMPIVNGLIEKLQNLEISDPDFQNLLGDLEDLSKEAVKDILKEKQSQLDNKVEHFVSGTTASFTSNNTKLGHTLVMQAGSLAWVPTASIGSATRVAISESLATKLQAEHNALNAGGGDTYQSRVGNKSRGGGTGRQINFEEKTSTMTWEGVKSGTINYTGYKNYHIDIVV